VAAARLGDHAPYVVSESGDPSNKWVVNIVREAPARGFATTSNTNKNPTPKTRVVKWHFSIDSAHEKLILSTDFSM